MGVRPKKLIEVVVCMVVVCEHIAASIVAAKANCGFPYRNCAETRIMVSVSRYFIRNRIFSLTLFVNQIMVFSRRT